MVHYNPRSGFSIRYSILRIRILVGQLINHVTLVSCNAVFSEISEVSKVYFESILLSPSMVKGVKQALSLDILVPLLVKLDCSRDGRKIYFYNLFVYLFLASKHRM